MTEVTNGTPMSGAASLIRSLEAADVDTVFGIPGGAILPAYDPLMDSASVRHILVRHEQGAGHAAEGYAYSSGKVGVCMATSGPGATNLVTPLADGETTVTATSSEGPTAQIKVRVEDFAQPTERSRPRRLPPPDEGMNEPQSDRKGQEDGDGKEE